MSAYSQKGLIVLPAWLRMHMAAMQRTTIPHSVRIKLCQCTYVHANLNLLEQCGCHEKISRHLPGAMLEARAHAGPGSSEAERIASILQLALGDALQGDMGPVERSHALSALIWAQVTMSTLLC